MENLRLPVLVAGQKSVRKCFTSTVIIWNESKLLSRLLYKSKNQMKAWKPFKQAQQLQRFVKNLAVLEAFLNRAPLGTRDEQRAALEHLDMMVKLIDATQTICQASFLYAPSFDCAHHSV